MIVLLRSTDGNPDSRFEKYVNCLEAKNIPYTSMCWDRKGNKNATRNKLYYKKGSEYGKRYGNIGGLVGFNKFLFKNLWKLRKHYQVIHACDFDTVLPATLMHILCGKKVIYDVFDWYVDSRNIKGIFKYIIYVIEWINIKCASAVIVCEPERVKQIKFKPSQIWVLPNIPNFSFQMPVHEPNKVLTIGYVGILGAGRCIEHAIRYAKEYIDINLEIGGFGPLESELSDIDKYPNIKYYGSVKYSRALEILNSVDVILACYSKWNADGTPNKNNILAAPNKYYEGLYLAHPIITTKGTIVGDKTIALETGYATGESYEDFCNVIKTITPEKNVKYSTNASRLWNEKYKTYVQDFLESTYLPFLLGHSK